MFDAITAAYVGSTAVLVLAGLVMVYKAVRAYQQTGRQSMMHLSVGFTIVVAATAGTVIAAFVTGFRPAQTMLLVNNGLTSLGYVFIVYSLISYEV